MYRSALRLVSRVNTQALRPTVLRQQGSKQISLPQQSQFINNNIFKFGGIRHQVTGSTLTKEDVLARSIAVLRGFEVKDPNEINMETDFSKDLGMDSLDYNDALVALEEEFDVVFDDKTANEIKNVGQCVNYILTHYLPAEDLLDREIR
ncbi:hypothetical protein B5S28_g508 [[Candida] boidinii]|uniref:Unnamed protein product n=1 Tax=Candida boidinii TaxID=5477 RepID=A0ACB5TGE3_CANBO|nr:hypothetical protein B5S28_g508 [[Candida] boidinii]OWB59197.1 hypothetical protein B5S29_g51 [[Candida] boidinii]OWB70423.1 hypothetical protein B5S31_g101 [[Candida] boidinii]OWB75915.1 hypothetical protein B5S32_g62 [[Candida] boidinii]GME78523.1 unnamed protein product [[Candida] boidinii]